MGRVSVRFYLPLKHIQYHSLLAETCTIFLSLYHSQYVVNVGSSNGFSKGRGDALKSWAELAQKGNESPSQYCGRQTTCRLQLLRGEVH